MSQGRKIAWGVTVGTAVGVVGGVALQAWCTSKMRVPERAAKNLRLSSASPASSAAGKNLNSASRSTKRRDAGRLPGTQLGADRPAESLAVQRDSLLQRMQGFFDLSEATVRELRSIFEASEFLSQGNPAVSEHAMTPNECEARRRRANVLDAQHLRCGEVNMVPLFAGSKGQSSRDARVCIDRFEFPNIACEYPVVWVRANEAMQICSALGKRLCDAHEWEGACAGDLRQAELEYAWGKSRAEARYLHNRRRERRWAYGSEVHHDRCATGSSKTASCLGGSWFDCGSNTYPAGAFPECVSPFGVYDQHGNVAEHMSLPLRPEQLGTKNGVGATEMKGSWFIFASVQAHDDDCRWRAPDWHPSEVRDAKSHRNYHLGFRCCKDVPGQNVTGQDVTGP